MIQRGVYTALTVVFAAGIGGLAFDYARAPTIAEVSSPALSSAPAGKTLEERIADARHRSASVQGVYMTYEVAADRGAAATRLRNAIEQMLQKREINAVVIDVKESEGLTVSDNLKKTLDDLHRDGAWVIARMTMMRDNSQTAAHPEWYIKKKNGAIWRDNHGNAWFDPADEGMWEYQRDAVMRAVNLGFDEVQFDYVRFPSDGNMNDVAYPTYTASRPKYDVIRNFLRFMHDALKSAKPELVLSADLFGYVAVQTEDLSIGQRLVDVADSVDYISLMVYPSHYYAGFFVKADPVRNLPEVNIPYKDPDPKNVVSSKPYPIIYRSMISAMDMLTRVVVATSTRPDGSVATTTTRIPPTVRMRPWLQDFDLGVDKARGIYYDAVKVREEIKAASDAGTSGWLLWNASNVYTTDALTAQPEEVKE